MKAIAAVVCAHGRQGRPTLAAPRFMPCTNFFTGDATPFIAEGITRDTVTGSVFVASVAGRRIVAIRHGRSRDFARLPDDYSPFGIAVAGKTLWVTAAVVAARRGP